MNHRFCSILTASVIWLACTVPSDAQVFEIEQLPIRTSSFSSGSFLNLSGHVAGNRTVVDGLGNLTRAYLWNGKQTLDIGNNGQRSQAYGLNDLDQVILTESIEIPGDPFPSTQRFAYFWDNGELTEIGSLGGTNTFPLDLNNAGKVVGRSSIIDGPFGTSRAFVWSREDGTQLLGSATGIIGSEALDINELDQVVGYTIVSHEVGIIGFFWSEETGLVEIGQIDRNGFLGINDNSQIAGMQRNADESITWFRCQVDIAEDGSVECTREEISSFGDSNEFRMGTPLAINNCGQVLGLAWNIDPAFDQRVAIWEPDGTVALQPTAWNGIQLPAILNDSGHVAFNAVVDFQLSAYYWDPGTNTTVRLPTLAADRTTASAINEFDEISGESVDIDRTLRAVVWRPLGPLPEGSAELLALIEWLTELWADGELFEGDFVSLLSKLTAADNQLRGGNTNAASGVLQSAQNQIEQLIRNNFIDEVIGLELIAAIDEIQSLL